MSIVVPTAALAREPRDQAFELLREIVQQNYEDGRRSYGASVKPELLRRTGGGFSEAAFGFRGFRAFMESAAEAGYVSVHKAPVGPDFEATPPGKEPLPVRDAAGGATVRVRPDLWRAFLLTDPGWAAAYDRDENRAFQYARQAFPLEPADVKEARERVQQQPGRHVPISPIPIEEQVRWMEDFAGRESDPAGRVALEQAVRSSRPNQAFFRALRAYPSVRARWEAGRRAAVYDHIRRWAAENSLEIEIAARDDRQPDPASESPPEHDGDRLATVRATLHRAIDRMSETDLLRVAVPVEYLIDR
jgi:hypothetical protein